MNKIILKQSRNWWIEKDLKWILDNAEFMFFKKFDNRPYIVTKEILPSSFSGCNSNCFKIDNDKYGLLLNSHCEYSNSYAMDIVKKTYHVKEYFLIWMKEWGCGEFINPSEFHVMISNIFRKKKDIILEIDF